MFSYDQQPQDTAKWQDRLDALFPPNTEISSLRIVWEPGLEWAPTGRFVLYQMLPASRIPVIFLPFLEGPDPRSFTRYDRVKKEVIRKRGAPLVSRQQWLMYREEGVFGMPYWVVQGERGGHKINFTKVERMIARLKGHPNGQPPAIGDLPYAPMDNRVIEKLVALDQMRTYNLLIDFAMRAPEMLEADEERGANEAKDRLWAWVESQVGQWVEELPHGGIERIAGLDRPIRLFT